MASGDDVVERVLINVKFTANGWEINNWNETTTADPPVLPYLWVAATGRGTVIRIATAVHTNPITGFVVQPGEVLGEHWSAPEGCRGSGNDGDGPSRTTVDFDGSVWVANRHDVQCDASPLSPPCGHVVKIGNGIAFQWVDRNHNGLIDTSSGLGDIRPWPNPNGICEGSDVTNAEDELILLYRPVPATGTRTVAVDRRNNVWVGGSGNRKHGLLNGWTGELFCSQEFPCLSCLPDAPFSELHGDDCPANGAGGYGGLVDAAGVLWSVTSSGLDSGAELLRYDLQGVDRCISVPSSYGLAADTLGRIWNTQWNHQSISRITADGNTIEAFAYPSDSTRGVVVTPWDNNAWAANSASHGITRLPQSGAPATSIFTNPLGLTPTGVAVDSRGFVWVTHRTSDRVQRVDPSTNTPNLLVELGAGAAPYNYSDMTGVNLYHTIAPAGVLSTTHLPTDVPIHWQLASWAMSGGGTISLSVRAADTLAGLGSQPYVSVENNEVPFVCKLVRGTYLQTRFQLNAASHASAWPILGGWTIGGTPVSNIPDCDADGIPDECEIQCGASDCNDNGIPDECDIAGGAPDCNGDGLPNECEPDCDQDGTPDGCEIDSGASCDADQNGIPDECSACCSGEQCMNTTQALCESPAVFWEDLLCSDCGGDGGCSTVQCCLGSTCSLISRCECLAQGGRPTLVECAPQNPCSTGVCCYSDGTCADHGPTGQPMVESDCTHRFLGGAFSCGEPGICDSPFVGAEPPTSPSGFEGFPKNRYISFIPGNAGRRVAFRVHLLDLPPPPEYEGFEGQDRWVGTPVQVTENAGSIAGSLPGFASFMAAQLECAPVFRDWWDVPGVLHVYDKDVIPKRKDGSSCTTCPCVTPCPARYEV